MRLAIFAGLVLTACGSQTIDLTHPIDGEGTPPIPCATSMDCGSGAYCEKATCTSAMGTCAAIPAECPAKPEITCGCDGITYANDCVRKAYGVSSGRFGPCAVDVPVSIQSR
jgi:Cys-rich repeat protein